MASVVDMGEALDQVGLYLLFIDLHLHLQSVSTQDQVLVGAVAQCEGAALA